MGRDERKEEAGRGGEERQNEEEAGMSRWEEAEMLMGGSGDG